ncbi:hypothetical protein ABT115_29510 [Streptomyces sp. NPDC001832]|uniref:hypothetical protein n=1 Tax=Streptomyces sp. NPDC001832 TaxID=3154527 RepID=UPI00332E3CE6
MLVEDQDQDQDQDPEVAQPLVAYTREKTLEGQESARKRGRTGGRPPSLDADQIEYTLTLRAKGTPMKEIQQKTVITRGKHKGKHPSLPTLYRTLAEAAEQRSDI